MAVTRLKTRDKRWKICIKCISDFPDKYGGSYKYDKARRNYARRCRRYVKHITWKWRDKHEWSKPCSCSTCDYKTELTIFDYYNNKWPFGHKMTKWQKSMKMLKNENYYENEKRLKMSKRHENVQKMTFDQKCIKMSKRHENVQKA